MGTDPVSALASIAQLLGLRDLKSICAVLTGFGVLNTWQRWDQTKWESEHGAWWALGTVLVGCIYAITIWRPRNLVKDLRFTKSDRYWGTGYLEDEARDGLHHAARGQLPYYVRGSNTVSYGDRDSHESYRSSFSLKRLPAFKFDHQTDERAEHYGSLAQRICGLKPYTAYKLTFYAKGSSKNESAFLVTTDLAWRNHIHVPSSPEWRQHELSFTTGNQEYAELRFVIKDRGCFWITRVVVGAPAWKQAS
jgi:hypothetical protein